MAKIGKSYSSKRYKCPYCNYHNTRVELLEHIDTKHEDLIPENYTAARVLFNFINKKEKGQCICGCGRETPWNEGIMRYERLTSDPKCKERYIKDVNARKIAKYGKWNLAEDPDFQNKMLKGRSISGTYKYSDGGLVEYVGSYEKKLHEFLDKVMGFKSTDVLTPGPTIGYRYKDKDHFYISDIYLISYNLIIEVKDGGSNPNTRSMVDYRAKQDAKEKQIIDDGEYNYVRVTDNQFYQLFSILAELKMQLIDDTVDKSQKIIRINEAALNFSFRFIDEPLILYWENGVTHESGIECIKSNYMMNNAFTGEKIDLADCNYDIFMHYNKIGKNIINEYSSANDLYAAITGHRFISKEQLYMSTDFTIVDCIDKSIKEESNYILESIFENDINRTFKKIDSMISAL